MATDAPTPIEPQPAPQPRSAQSKKIEKGLITIEQLITALLAEPLDIAAELAEGSYTSEALNLTLAGQKNAFAIFVAQGVAEFNQKAATKALKAADRSARIYYRSLRAKGKSAFMKDPEGRGKLRLDGLEPKPLKGIIGAARALALEGSKPEYTERLARKGVTAAKLARLTSLIDALEAADLAQETAKAAAPTATAQRDMAAKALSDWLAEFKLFAKGQFGDRPEILKRWGLK